MFLDSAEWCGVNSNEPHLAPGDPESATFSLSDVMTSQGITFRDPETGAIYVQTQLLQVYIFTHTITIRSLTLRSQSYSIKNFSHLKLCLAADAILNFK